MPEVVLYEYRDDNPVYLNDIYKEFLFHNEIESIKIDTHKFKMYFLKKENRQKNHYLYLCQPLMNDILQLENHLNF